MVKVSMFLGVCIAIYAIFSYLEVKAISKINMDITMEFLDEYRDEVMPIIIEDVSLELVNLFKEHIDVLATIGIVGMINEVIEDVNKEKITETRAEDYEESTRD